MSIEYYEVEKRMKVITPGNHKGVITLTNRQISLAKRGLTFHITVTGTDGIKRVYSFLDLELDTATEEREIHCPYCGREYK